MDAGRQSDKRQTIFQGLLTANDSEGYVVPTVDQIKDEAYSILAAAADTTGNAMTVAAYHVTSDPAIYKKLTMELKTSFPDSNTRLDFVTLEKLPYLVGIPSPRRHISLIISSLR
jgi:cytochrome P450